MVRRRWIAGSLLLLVGPGCHLGHREPAATAPRPEPLVSQVDAQAAKFIAQHNRNAAQIRSMEAKDLSVTVNGRRMTGGLKGSMAMERDRNFTLDLAAIGHAKANIGSNDQEFWFWVDDEDNALWTCDYRDLDSCGLAATFQPDWIMEAMGLRPFSEREAKTLVAKPGPLPGSIVLTQQRPDARGQGYTKETTVNKDGQITEHKLFDAATKQLLAEAKIRDWNRTSFLDGDGGDEAASPEGAVGASAASGSVVLPENFRLSWTKEKIALEISIKPKSLVINPTFSEERRLALFSEPKIAGATKRNLAMFDPATSQASGTAPAAGSRVIETRPMPPTGGVRIGDPEPSPLDSGKASRRAIDPIPLGPDLGSTSAQPAGVVGAPYPTADSAITRSSILGRRRAAR